MSFTANTCKEIFDAMPVEEQNIFKQMILDTGNKTRNNKPNQVPFLKSQILSDTRKKNKNN